MENTEFKTFEINFENQIEKLQDYYNQNKAVQKKINLQDEINKYPTENKEFILNTKDEFRGLIAKYLQNSIQTNESLQVYCLTITKQMLGTIGIINFLFNQTLNIKDKSIDNEKRKLYFNLNKEFKDKYTERFIYDMFKEELLRICKLNGIILS